MLVDVNVIAQEMKKKKSQRKFTPVFFIFAILGWGGYWFSPYLLDSIPPILKVGKLIDQEIYSGKIDVEIMSTDPTLAMLPATAKLVRSEISKLLLNPPVINTPSNRIEAVLARLKDKAVLVELVTELCTL